MEKRWVSIFIVTMFIGILSIHASRGFVFEEESGNVEKVQFQEMAVLSDTETLNATETIQESGTEIAAESTDGNTVIYNHFQFLRETLSDKEIGEMGWDLVDRGICDYSEEVKGEFVPVIPENCSYPEGLVVMMEEIFYRCANIQRIIANYDEILKELGAEEFTVGLEETFQLFPKISEYREEIEDEYDAYDWVVRLYIEEKWEDLQHCVKILHFRSMKGQENYIFLCMSQGTGKFIEPYFMQRNGDEFTEIETFSIPPYGGTKIIQYGEKFYYVSLENNEALDDYDGIRIYDLDEDLWRKCLVIRYLPEEYVWSDLYTFRDMEDKAAEEMDLYIDKIKQEFSQGNYLGNGMQIYYGDEMDGVSVKMEALGYDGCSGYPVDIANIGKPVYVWKDLGNYMFDYLDISFFRDPASEAFSIDHSSLVQMWFKEICGKIYTFRVFHISDYNYLFNVLLLEGDKSTVIRTAMIAPQRKFVVEENDEGR